MSSQGKPIAGLTAAFAFCTIVACGESLAPTAAPDEALLSAYGATLVECPTSATISAERTIGALGGSVEVRNHRLEVALGGVLLPTVFTLTAPASKYLVLEVKAGGEDSFDFEKPATITIDYSRCTRSNIDRAALTVWKVDRETKELLYQMDAADDKEARTIRFTTETLSAYAIAN